MRKIVMFNRVTPEGYFAGPDGDYQSLIVPDQEVDRDGAKGIPGTDTVILGRRTYKIFDAFWPHALENPNLPPEARAFAIGLNDMTKLVFSTTLKEVTWKNSRLLRKFDPDEIQSMKMAPGKNMIVLGSGSIVSQLAQHRLIDEYQFVISPVLIGSGQPLLRGLSSSVALELKEAKAYPSGNVMLRYAPTGARQEYTHFQKM
ncbi:MAG: dihydrofolate reductase family protein [Nitrososphaerales archaeon]